MKKIIITLFVVLFAFSLFAAATTAKVPVKKATVVVAIVVPTPEPTPTPLSFMAKVKNKVKSIFGIKPAATPVPVVNAEPVAAASVVPAAPVKK